MVWNAVIFGPREYLCIDGDELGALECWSAGVLEGAGGKTAIVYRIFLLSSS